MAYIGGNRQSQNILTKMKIWGFEDTFSSQCAVKAQKLTDVCLFKVKSVLSKRFKNCKKKVKFPKFALNFAFFYFYLTLTQL